MEIKQLAKILWDYNYIPSPPASADVLIVMGTNDLGVPRHAAKLACEFSYRHIIVTGGVHWNLSLHGEPFGGPEAEVFQRIMVKQGCREDLILLEHLARNTGANVLESKALLEKTGTPIRTGQLIHTPTMQRRALATAEKQWPEVSWRISGQPTTFEAYIQNLNFEKWLHGLVGDTYRIHHYPTLGFQTEQPMPPKVKNALRTLLEKGYTNTLREGFSLQDLEP